MGNSTINVGGSVTNSAIVAGDNNVIGNDNRVEVGAEASLEALAALLAEMRDAVANLPVEPAQRDAALGDLAVLEAQTQAPEPNVTLIQSRLKLVTDTLATIGGGAGGMEKVLALGTSIGGMIAKLWT